MTVMIDSDDPADIIYPNLASFRAVFTINMGVEVRNAAGTTVTDSFECPSFSVTILDFCGTVDLYTGISPPAPSFDVEMTLSGTQLAFDRAAYLS